MQLCNTWYILVQLLYIHYAMHHSMLPGTTWHFTQLGNDPTCPKHATCVQHTDTCTRMASSHVGVTKLMTIHLFCKGMYNYRKYDVSACRLFCHRISLVSAGWMLAVCHALSLSFWSGLHNWCRFGTQLQHMHINVLYFSCFGRQVLYIADCCWAIDCHYICIIICNVLLLWCH